MDKTPWTKKKKKLLVLVTYNESIFNANNGKRRVQKEKGKSLLQTKKKGKRIIVSEFLTLVRRLRIFNFIPNHQLF